MEEYTKSPEELLIDDVLLCILYTFASCLMCMCRPRSARRPRPALRGHGPEPRRLHQLPRLLGRDAARRHALCQERVGGMDFARLFRRFRGVFAGFSAVFRVVFTGFDLFLRVSRSEKGGERSPSESSMWTRMASSPKQTWHRCSR